MALCGPLALMACGGAQTGTTTADLGASPKGYTATSIPVDGDPNGLWWDEAAATLYVADAKNNRVLKWTDAAGFSTAAELPPTPPEGGGLGQVVKLADGTASPTSCGSCPSTEALVALGPLKGSRAFVLIRG